MLQHNIYDNNIWQNDSKFAINFIEEAILGQTANDVSGICKVFSDFYST